MPDGHLKAIFFQSPRQAICRGLLLLLAIIFPSILQAHPTGLPVLVYHHIEDPAKSDVSCTPEQFRLQIEALIKAGFTPITLGQARLFLATGVRPVHKPVLITFDDGYESLYHHALPVAKLFDAAMTVFVITSRLGRKPQFIPYLTPDQIREMTASGLFEFGSHSHDLHTDILRIFNSFPEDSPNPVTQMVEEDLALSVQVLKDILGTKPSAIAWPYGKFNPSTSRAARNLGFTMHFTSRFGYNMPGDDIFAIKRVPISKRDTPESVVRKANGVFR